ncbi:MmgE/PrpD family protein [Flavobacteriales bacterium]|nr:MmgE/PrpD family protein [Flavobacteriales bacterium]
MRLKNAEMLAISSANTTKEVVQIAERIQLNQIDPAALLSAKKIMRDGLGVLILGLQHETIDLLKKYFAQNETVQGVQLLGGSLKLSKTDAAFIYGCAIHSMDFEPMFLPPTHAVSPVLAPLIALAQSGEGSGELFLKAFVAGIQLEADLRKAAEASDVIAAQKENHFPFDRHGFHPPGTVGPMGSAMASSILLEMNNEKKEMAIGHAASRSSGLSVNIGTMTKATHCGAAARSGLESAFLVNNGLTASNNGIEGPSGWAHVFGGEEFNFNQIITGMQQLDCFTSPGFAFKKWPAHTAMQIAIDAGLQHYSEGIIPKEITIITPVFKYCNRPFPKDSDEARFSFQYNVAVAILDGRIDDDSFSESKLRSKAVQHILFRTNLKMSRDIPADFGKMSVIIKTNDGRRSISDSWSGHWKRPATEEQLLNKFIRCTQQKWSKNEAIKVSKFIMNIEHGDNYQELISLLNNL